MLDKPDIQDAVLVEALREHYALPIQGIRFLPLGADRNTAVYRAESKDGLEYFVKIRLDDFNEMSLIIPRFLSDQSVSHIIAPLLTCEGEPWVQIDGFYLSVYPHITGLDGYETGLTDTQWIELGETLQRIHASVLPSEIAMRIPRESFSDKWRKHVRYFQQQVDQTVFNDPVSAKLANLLRQKREAVDTLVRRADRLGLILQNNAEPFVLCHADIHAWNLLIQTDGTFYVVDWDTVILAPKERDLMFVGSGLFRETRTPEQIEALFYQGYGRQSLVDPVGLAYYRYERIVQDIAEYCERIFLTDASNESRTQGLAQLSVQFEPDQVVDLALRSERSLPTEIREADMDRSLKYYETNAQSYFERVHNWDMSALYEIFFKHITGKTVLDLGCGTGRDARFFSDKGYQVVLVDGSQAMLAIAQRECPAAESILIDFNNSFKIGKPLDAIWACASLLHLDDETFERVLKTIVEDLNPNGVIYLGLKQADHSDIPNDGRIFNYWTWERLAPIAIRHGLIPIEHFVDVTPRITWLNAFFKKTANHNTDVFSVR